MTGPLDRLGEKILWHAARYRLSVTAMAAAFCVTRHTITNWRGALGKTEPCILPRPGSLSDLVHELVVRLKAEWPEWGTRRIAGQLARLGVKASRSSVQRTLRRSRAPKPDDRLVPRLAAGLLAKRPNHIWMIDFTRLGGVVTPVFVGVVLRDLDNVARPPVRPTNAALASSRRSAASKRTAIVVGRYRGPRRPEATTWRRCAPTSSASGPRSRSS